MIEQTDAEPINRAPAYKDPYLWAILALSLAIFVFGAAYIHSQPPLDGDSYEYAGAARNYLHEGSFTARHLSGYMYPDYGGRPHLSYNRATLWTVLLLPFQHALGTSIWSFVLPGLLSLLFLGPIVYLFARRFFSRPAAFAATLATILNPRLLNWSLNEDPGLPDVLGVVFFTAAMLLFLRRRWVWSGIMTGGAILVRLTGVLLPPLFILWLLLFDRQAFRRSGPYLYLLAAFLTVSPLMARNAVFFGHTLYVDTLSNNRMDGPEMLEIYKNFSVWDAWFAPEPIVVDGKTADRKLTPRERLTFAFENGKQVLLGYYSGITYYPGFFEMMGLALAPFFLAGAWFARKKPQFMLLTLFIGGLVGGLVFMKSGYEDRYLFPALPFAMMLAMHGAEKLAPRFKLFSVNAVLGLFLVTSSLPFVFSCAIKLGDPVVREDFNEMLATCQWAREHLPREAKIMTTPFWSPQYFCDRFTIPPPVGGLETLKKTVNKYQVDYFMFLDIWGGDRFPNFTFLTPLLLGPRVSLYRIERRHPDFRRLERRYGYMIDFDFLRYFWAERIPTHQGDVSTFKALWHLSGHLASGVALYLLLCFLLLGSFKLKPFRLALGAVLALSLLTLFARLVVLMEPSGQLNLAPPALGLRQLELYLTNSEAGRRIDSVRLGQPDELGAPAGETGAGESAPDATSRPWLNADEKLEALASAFSRLEIPFRAQDAPPPLIDDPADEGVFIPFEDEDASTQAKTSIEAAELAAQSVKQQSARAAKALQTLGRDGEVLAGGVLLAPPATAILAK